MSQKAILCCTCKGKRPIPGDCHVRCGPKTDEAMKADPLLEGFSMLGGVGRGPLAGVTNWMNFDPCFPTPVTECDKYQPKDATNGS